MNRNLALIGLWLAVMSLPALGQGNVTSREEWDRYLANADKILAAHPFRTKMTVETRPTENEPWKFYSYQEIEEIKPDRTHIRYRDGYYEEIIRIGQTSYSKRPNSAWQVGTHDSSTPPVTVGTIRELSAPVVEFKNLGSQALLGEQMTVLEMIVTRKIQNLGNGTIDEGPRTLRFWFDRQGRYRRSESIAFTSSAPGPRFIRTTLEYEYDPNIKIVAPVP